MNKSPGLQGAHSTGEKPGTNYYAMRNALNRGMYKMLKEQRKEGLTLLGTLLYTNLPASRRKQEPGSFNKKFNLLNK